MIRLSDEHWERIRDHFPEEHIPDGRPGRKPVPTRRVLEAVLWILDTGAQWHMLPQSYPNYKTVHRRFQSWCHSEVLRQVLTDVANELRDKGVLDEEESFCPRKRQHHEVSGHTPAAAGATRTASPTSVGQTTWYRERLRLTQMFTGLTSPRPRYCWHRSTSTRRSSRRNVASR